MKRHFDEITLSTYMDGELDELTMAEVEAFIESNQEAADYILRNVKHQARLKSSLNQNLGEDVPERFRELLISEKTSSKINIRLFPQMIRVAAVFVVMIFGFGAGLLYMGKQGSFSPLQYPLSKQFNQAIADTLESNLSGISSQYDPLNKDEHFIVTPIQTYPGADKKYYRQFQLQYVRNADRTNMNITGLAYRTGPNEWKTTAFFFNP